MTKRITLLSTLASALLTSYSALAAETAELKVGGTINPTACSLTLDSAGTIDFGNILANTLNDNVGTKLGQKTIGLAITCDGLTKFAVKVSDNRADSIVPGLATVASGGSDATAFGLGKVGGKNIGVFMVSISGASSTSLSDLTRATSPNLRAWNGLADAFLPGANYMAWNRTSEPYYNPAPLKDLRTSINVTAVIDKKTNLPVTQQIRLDGSATLELVYL